MLVSLVDTPWTSIQVQEALARNGVFVRECSNYCGLEVGSVVTGVGQAIETRGHLRFCVRTPADNNLLLESSDGVLRIVDVDGKEPEYPKIKVQVRWK